MTTRPSTIVCVPISTCQENFAYDFGVFGVRVILITSCDATLSDEGLSGPSSESCSGRFLKWSDPGALVGPSMSLSLLK